MIPIPTNGILTIVLEILCHILLVEEPLNRLLGQKIFFPNIAIKKGFNVSKASNRIATAIATPTAERYKLKRASPKVEKPIKTDDPLKRIVLPAILSERLVASSAGSPVLNSSLN